MYYRVQTPTWVSSESGTSIVRVIAVKNEFSGPSLPTFKSFNVRQEMRTPDRSGVAKRFIHWGSFYGREDSGGHEPA